MDKKELVRQILEQLEGELKVLEEAARSARDAATSEENKAENQYDTRAIEAGYLAGAQAKRAADLQRQIQVFKYMPIREYTNEDAMCAGGIAELEHNGTKTFCLMIPQGGGLVMRFNEHPVQVITPASPMGEALLGKMSGETVEVETKSGMRSYKIISVR